MLADTLRKHWRVNIDMTSSVFASIGSLRALQVTSGEAMLAGAAAAAGSRLATLTIKALVSQDCNVWGVTSTAPSPPVLHPVSVADAVQLIMHVMLV